MKNYDLLPFGFGREPLSRNIFGDLNALLDKFGSLSSASQAATEWAPRLDVAEDAKTIRLQAELPGMTEKDIDVQVHGNLLTIKGQKILEREEKETDWHVIERRSGNFLRTIQLPFEPDDKSVEAVVKDGVLNVKVAKPENGGAKKIAVKAAS
jgi:HSP20 family protein